MGHDFSDEQTQFLPVIRKADSNSHLPTKRYRFSSEEVANR